MSITIVEATIEDTKDIAKVQTEAWVCAYPNADLGISKGDLILKTEEFDRQGLGRIKDEISKENSKTSIAKVGGKTVGFIGASKNGDLGKIEALHVLPEFQGQGIGTELLKTALRFLKDIKQITIEVVSYNAKAIKFYQSFGFKNTGEIVKDKIDLPGGHKIEKILMVRNEN